MRVWVTIMASLRVGTMRALYLLKLERIAPHANLVLTSKASTTDLNQPPSLAPWFLHQPYQTLVTTWLR